MTLVSRDSRKQMKKIDTENTLTVMAGQLSSES